MGADPNKKDNFGESAFGIAIHEGHRDMAELLKTVGAKKIKTRTIDDLQAFPFAV